MAASVVAAALALLPSRDGVKRTVSSVEGFELQHSGAEGDAFPFFEIGYAIWANYLYFTYHDETYERAGAGGVIIRRHEVRPTHYLVHEEIKSHDAARRRVLGSTIRISDKQSGEVLASRSFRDGEIENGTGWVG